jgi:hypothetical protein
MIYQKDSTALHLRMGRRHERLCGRVPGAEPFAAAIRPAQQPPRNTFCEENRNETDLEAAKGMKN